MKKIYSAFIMVVFFTFLLGCIYPLFLWGIGKLFFPHKAGGSLVMNKKTHEIIGSTLIGQKFQDKKYFHGRPSSCNYDGMNSQSSNLGPTSQKLQEQIQKNIQVYKKENHLNDSFQNIPSDAVFASGSGLDPHISVENAYLQAERIARERQIPYENVRKLIDHNTIKPVIGPKYVSVLSLNAKLDHTKLKKMY
jgi:K+-transporting ATPase ATPase C chain